MTHTYTLRASSHMQIHVRVPITRDALSELPNNIVYPEVSTGTVQYLMMATTQLNGLLVCEMCDTPSDVYLVISGVIPHYEAWHLLCSNHFTQEPLITLDKSVSCLLCPSRCRVHSPTTDGFIVRSRLDDFAPTTARSGFCHGCKVTRADTHLCECCSWYMRYHVMVWWYIRQLLYCTLPLDITKLIYDARMLEDRAISNEYCHDS